MVDGRPGGPKRRPDRPESGMARSIRRLFEGVEEARRAEGAVSSSRVAGRGQGSRRPSTLRDRFTTQMARYLASTGPSGRDPGAQELVPRLHETVARLRDQGEDAVLREAGTALTRRLASGGVDDHDRLAQLMRVLPGVMVPVAAEVLAGGDDAELKTTVRVCLLAAGQDPDRVVRGDA